MTKQITVAITIGIFFVLLTSCGGVPQRTLPLAMSPTAHSNFIVGAISLDLPSFSFSEVTMSNSLEKSEIVPSPDHKFEAFIVNSETSKLFFEDKTSHQAFEILGAPLPYRPYSNLVWSTSTTLTVDRWSSPHYGIRYTVDVIAKRFISAFPMTDMVQVGPK